MGEEDDLVQLGDDCDEAVAVGEVEPKDCPGGRGFVNDDSASMLGGMLRTKVFHMGPT